MAEGGQGCWLRLIWCLLVFWHACLMVIDSAVLENVSDELQAYVYMLVDPDSGVPFYVGKGHRLRHGDHVAEALASLAGVLNPVEESPEDEEESGKVAKIKEILNRGTGSEPEVWIIRYGLQKAEYTAAEAALIDLLMTFPVVPRRGGEARTPLGCREQLANARRESARGHGITLLRTLIDDYAAPPLVTRAPLLLITLNGSHDMPDGEEMADGRLRYWAGWDDEWLVSSVREKSFPEIGESVSGWWRIDLNKVTRLEIEHVAAVHRGVTRALFRIEPGSWKTRTDEPVQSGKPVVRKAFRFQVVDRGDLFNHVIGPHGHRVPARARGDQSFVNYWPRH
jgi:uncharacterized protein